MVEIILLAMVALFVGLRLFSVLGERTGHEQEPRVPQRVDDQPKVATVPKPVADIPPEPAGDIEGLVAPNAVAAVRKIASSDHGFDINEFLIGAQSAYRLILEAFWKGDKDTLGDLVSDDVRQSFEAAIDDREEQGHVLDNRLVAIEKSQVVDASVRSGMARITMRFDADIAAVTRDKDGEVIAGSLSDAVQTHDLWTFERNLRSNDPNWLLVETDEES